MNHRLMIGIGFLLVVFGTAMPFLMVLHLVESTFLLNFLGFAASVVGLTLGVVGSAIMVRIERSKRDDNDRY